MDRSIRRALGALALATGLLVQPAHAAVSVTLRISSYTYALADVTCTLSVSQGADGVAVLTAGVEQLCIEGFTTHQTSLGTYLDCIDDGTNGNRCGDPYPTFLRFWSMRENCEPTGYGVDGFRAAAGDELSFTYETPATLFAPAFKPETAPDC